MAPVVTRSPMPRKRFSRLRRKRPRPDGRLPGWTGNALVTGLITVVLSGVLSYLVAHYQTQDSAAQALAGQQREAAAQLETAATNYYRDYDKFFIGETVCSITTAADPCYVTPPNSDTLFADETALSVAEDNISDSTARALVHNLITDAVTMTSEKARTDVGLQANSRLLDEYSALMSRCGQIIQGQA